MLRVARGEERVGPVPVGAVDGVLARVAASAVIQVVGETRQRPAVLGAVAEVRTLDSEPHLVARVELGGADTTPTPMRVTCTWNAFWSTRASWVGLMSAARTSSGAAVSHDSVAEASCVLGRGAMPPHCARSR